MKIPNKKSEMFCQNISPKKKLKAFTLVELIIVITILAILATIAFVSFQGYMKGARDSNRVTTITQINKGIQTFQTTTGNVPNIDNQIGTGTLSGNAVTYVGYVGDSVSSVIKLNKTPIDPSTNTKYIYGIDVTKTKYQVATIVEDLQSNTNKFITQTYADGGLKARVLGNYEGLLTYSGKLYNIPSLIITFSGTINQDLLATDTNYVIDKAENLPYLTSQSTQLKTLEPTDVLKRLTNTGGLIVTGITLPTKDTWNNPSSSSSGGSLESLLGYDSDLIGQNIFGNKYFSEIKGNTSLSSAGGGNIFLQYCTASGQMYYIDSIGNKLASVTNTGVATWVSGKSVIDLTCTGNIVVCTGNTSGYILQACNAGATILYTNQTFASATIERSATVDGWAGYLYQWGRNKGFSGAVLQQATSIAGDINANGDMSGFVWNPTFPNPYTWSNTGITENWGVSEVNKVTAIWAGSTEINKAKMQGPCPTGYHIPTNKEWTDVIITGGWCINGCGGFDDLGPALKNTLKLPFAGIRSRINGNMSGQGDTGIYCSSSPDNTNGFSPHFSAISISPSASYAVAYGYSIRCFKN